MPQLSLLAPAKLNLFLHITGRREDGYHNLQTLFQLLDVGDELKFEAKCNCEIILEPELEGVAPEDNLIVRAARLLQQEAGKALPSFSQGAKIQLLKRLPMGGGIGGGSSNAATTLLGLNHLWNLHFSIDHLAELGAALGADIPVFVRGQTAWAEGVGDLLQPLEMEEKWYLVLVPQCHVSTAEIFCHKDLTRDTPNITVAAFLEQGGRNDCQPLVRRLFPQVDEALYWLSDHSDNARMSGTGACVFAAFASPEAAEAVLKQLPSHIKGFVARGVNQSPAHQLLQ